MRRTMLALIEPTIPLDMASRAKSSLFQCVMCKPCAMGSMQASSTSWARCRGGNVLRSSRARLILQQLFQTAGFVTATGSPDRGRITAHQGRQACDRCPFGNRQHDARSVYCERRQLASVSDALQNRKVMWVNAQATRSPAAHDFLLGPVRKLPNKRKNIMRLNFLHYFVADPLGAVPCGS